MVEVVEVFETGKFDIYEDNILKVLDKYDYNVTWNIGGSEPAEIAIVHKQEQIFISIPLVGELIGDFSDIDELFD